MSHLSYSKAANNSSNVHFIEPNAEVVRERDMLFQMGDQLDGIYKVNSGCIKLFRNNEAGESQIIGFYMAGDLIGLDALADGYSHSTAVILETSNVTLIPFESILNKDEKFDSQAFIRQLGVNVNHDNDHTMMLTQPAGRRMAWFLTGLSDRLAERGLLANEFRIPMTCTDIALYLGMASETSSREIGAFCKQGLMKKHNRDIELLNIEALRHIANGDNADEENTGWNNGNYSAMTHKESALVH